MDESEKLLGMVMSNEIFNPEIEVGTLNAKTFESGQICRVNEFLSNPDIFPPAIFWVCGGTKIADLKLKQRIVKFLKFVTAWCCNANERYIYLFLINQAKIKKKSIILSSQRLKICFIGLLETKFLTPEWLSLHAIVYTPEHFCNGSETVGRYWAKCMRNTGQVGRLQTICTEILFNILTGGWIFNP